MKQCSHCKKYSVLGFFLGSGAPLGWALLRLVFFYDPGEPLVAQFLHDITRDGQQRLLYVYMGVGTAFVLATLGYLIGKNGDELRQRAIELDGLHQEVASQKEIFEHRFVVLNTNITSFH
jgi:hypothetical protein